MPVNFLFTILVCTRPPSTEAVYDGPLDSIPPKGKLQLKCNEKYKEMVTYVECIGGDQWTNPEPPCEGNSHILRL